MRAVRAVPAALPDVPSDRRGVGVASRAHLAHARGATARRRGRRRVRRLHGRVRAVPGLRAGVPAGVPFGRLMERTRDAGGDASVVRASVAPARLSPARSPPARRRRVSGSGRRATAARVAPLAVPSPRPSGAGAAATAALEGERLRRLALHRLCDGRVGAPCARQRRPRDRSDGCGRGVPLDSRRCGLLRRARRARRADRRRAGDGSRGDGVDARRRADPRRQRRLRRGDEGLRAPRRHRRGARVQPSRRRHPRMAGSSRRPAAGGRAR